jgi:23S rRNA G2445 N2-methylase RlmL
MHGYKATINWGSLRETYACALIYSSNIIERFYKTNNLLVWDPFCGSGTILIEMFFLALRKPARNIEDITKETFVNLPFHDKEKFKKFIEEEKKSNHDYVINLPEKINIKFIASDIDTKSIVALSGNSVKAELNKYVIKKQLNEHTDSNNLDYKDEINLSINPTIYHEKINNIFDAFIGDFEVIFKEVINNEKIKTFKEKKFTIFSNIPYGTSHEMSNIIQIKSLYRRFGRFLRKYENKLDEVYILVNKRLRNDELNFQNLTELNWKVLEVFDNNGIEVEFLKLDTKGKE